MRVTDCQRKNNFISNLIYLEAEIKILHRILFGACCCWTSMCMLLSENTAFDFPSLKCQGPLKKDAHVALCAASPVLPCEISSFENQLLVKVFLPIDITLSSTIKMHKRNAEVLGAPWCSRF